MPDAQQLFFLLVDGDEPTSWMPWELPFEVVAKKLQAMQVKLSPSELRQRHFRISLLLHSPEVAASRSTSKLVRVVGVVVDGINPEANAPRTSKLKDCFADLCHNLLQTDASSMYRRVGFHIIVAAAEETDAHIVFRQDLERIAEYALGQSVPLEVYSVNGDEFLLWAVSHQTRSMIRHNRRYSAKHISALLPS